MSRTEYVASKPTSVFPLPRTRLLGKSFARNRTPLKSSQRHHNNGANVLEPNPDPSRPPVRVITSRKRRRTVAARLRSGVLELLVPASMTHAERDHWAEVMSRRLQRRAERSRPSDERLLERARRLNQRHFEGKLRWRSIGFSDMERLWGSCTFTDGAIRIARRAASLPDWVLDYLLVHELAHLVHSDHGSAFHELENRYPLTERAKGYLLALDSIN
ncbi:MAG: M48 family metallopeptidase [Chloroflexi bacterium]|nr:MAG: M48 family metallopeptidase [Chloroflexota bacterium]